ncbi:hypothetical protein [Paraglaciecola psychrophila]|jgi:hypothetical protein|uniref:Uncharacterized protein n=1 Tax=Paraglaciecola psychrophila 170 TaxID=1129794 RepID=K7AC80_9ALTE|nr:hypothetical protein [Paraglaciecola psychrophila]AGH46811.1 hypothetical protein C427_4712 [Paraglaciecola psychrophila 170]GAC39862.1 hypothetical protein GPSY_4251 [Paraglaciecola psychrophila 170]
MALNFLCPVHRDWVYFHPQDALTQLEETQQQGEALMQKREWQEAIMFFGSAFETTEILIELQGNEKSFLLSRLTTLAMLLATSFAKLNAMTYGQLILKQAQTRLQLIAENSLGNQPKQEHVEQCLVAVKSSLEQLVFIHPLAQDMSSAQIH